MIRSIMVLLSALIILGAAADTLSAADAFTERMRRVQPGMTRREVSSILGEPQAVLQKYVDVYGRYIEVWRYAPDASVVRRSPVKSSAADLSSVKSQAWRDTQDWKRIQEASYNNPADPLYRSDQGKVSRSTRVPASQAYLYGSASPSYQAVFVNGRLQDIRLSAGA